MNIVLIANSPGELSALVKPLAKRFKEKSFRIILFITPCQYASGKEVEFAKKHLAVDEVVSAEDYKKWLLGTSLPFSFDPEGICVFLGGDLLHAALIAKKLNYPSYAYIAGKQINWTNAFKKFYLPDQNMLAFFQKKKVPNLLVSGDLMVDSFEALSREEAREKWHISPEIKVVALLAGSRKWEIDFMLPLYEKIGKILKKENITLMLVVSPFISMEEITKYKEHQIFDVFAYQDSLPAADLALTIPGTNTANIAVLGIPMLLVFPLNNPEVIPLEGTMHYIGSIPIVKFAIKRLFAWWINKTTKYFALPNIKANKKIVPEIRGKVKPKNTARAIINLLKDKNRLFEMSQLLKESMGNHGAADVIVKDILNAK
ncbi:MAG: hypothetical protein FD145_1517 [Candidatus Saganbacteria bacterium]|uniref:Lipid-A-disaccharide synthase n=1 Tax=Candidatus Saganbacteria bacterium TaxID=2575572 RepID=A0A833NRC0_UNCSA|nr:MAG: hypothetical protein FD145_1517 [Candidatus Saganbacteria bacterium]